MKTEQQIINDLEDILIRLERSEAMGDDHGYVFALEEAMQLQEDEGNGRVLGIFLDLIANRGTRH